VDIDGLSAVMVFSFSPSLSGAAAHLGRFLRGEYGKDKMRPYDAASIGNRRHERFTVRYYIVAMLFLIFDVETIFLLPWAIILWAGISRSLSSRSSRCLFSSAF